MKKLVKWLHGNKGFTLIELLVVVAILGTLAAVVTPSVISFMKTGNVSAANAELASIQTAVDGYMTEKNTTIPPAFDATLSPYLRMNWAEVKGEYQYSTIEGETGTVWAKAGGGWDGVAVNETTHRFEKE